MKSSYLLSASALILLAACSPAQTPERETTPTPEASAPTEATVPFTNAMAMDTYGTLAPVFGAPAPLPETATSSIDNPEAVFADAITYAAETDSYALLIWKDGALVLEKYFEPYDASIRSEPASMHKSVLGLVTARAMQDGFIEGPEQPVSDFLTEWENDPRGEITVGQLLTMSAGLAALSYEGGETSPGARFMAGTLEDVEGTLLGLQPEEGMGPHFHYQNTFSQLLMMVVERAKGENYTDYLSAKIWQPIGAEDGYVYTFGAGGMPRGYASFLARPLDWLRLGLLIKDDGMYAGEEIISADLIDQMTAPSELNPNYGWQIWRGATFQEERYYNDEGAGFAALSSEPYLVDDIIFFDGFGGQRVIISKSEDLVIVRLGDTQLEWDDSALPNAVISALNAD